MPTTFEDLHNSIVELGAHSLRQGTALICIRNMVEEFEARMRESIDSGDMQKVRDCEEAFVREVRRQLEMMGISMHLPDETSATPHLFRQNTCGIEPGAS
ncbi:MAG: hypothetical protein PHX93_04860 [Candidatus Peribacteraceae bacterium]|jgi:hypothetical protein|nr:hypothetical protein [Candidatus Peribacteraceae bacterium]